MHTRNAQILRMLMHQKTSKSPLHYAVLFANVDTIQALVECGAKLDVQNTTGMTAFQCALSYYSGGYAPGVAFAKRLRLGAQGQRHNVPKPVLEALLPTTASNEAVGPVETERGKVAAAKATIHTMSSPQVDSRVKEGFNEKDCGA